MAGRKPLPTKTKVIKGTFQDCRGNKNEPKPATKIPAAPDHLDKAALIEWGRISAELEKMGLISEIDMAALAAYCQAYSRWLDAENQLAEQGLTITTMSGNIIQNPLVRIANKAMLIMHRYLSEFGMTPSSRSKVSALPTDGGKSKNPFAKIG